MGTTECAKGKGQLYLLIYCCVTEYPKTVALNNEHLVFHSFCASGIWVQLSWVPLPQGLSQSHNQAWSCDPILRLGGEICFWAHSWVLAGLRSSQVIQLVLSLPHWLLTGTALSSLLWRLILRAAHNMTEEERIMRERVRIDEKETGEQNCH